MKKSLLIVLSGFVWLTSSAQKSGNIKGIVFDTIARQSVPAATITVLQAKDSSLVTFTMTNSRGEFSLANVAYGDYRLLVTHVNYHNVNKYFTVNEANKSIDLSNIEVSDKNKVLEEVVIMAEAPPVTLIGDTVQYNAGSFKTKPNAVVEDLLKRMPGIQVDKDGKIKAQGQEVKRVLVDGKEFFGNDPKIATKNLPADAVDKVQVYDKQSDMSQLTGFDDGQSEKTINLKLKKDKKKGVFGKVNGGGGTDGRYEGKFNVNSFKGARQMSVIGMGNNTNAEGFSFMDILSFSGGMNQLGGNSGGGMNITMSDAMAGSMGGGNNNAINTTWAGGANYNNIIGKKMEIQSNYFYNHYNPVTDQKLSRQYILPDSTYFYNQNSRTDNNNNSHRFNLTYDYLIDSMNSIKFTPTLNLQNSKNHSLSKYETLSEQLIRSNRGASDNFSASDGYNFNGTLLYRKKFRRKGRTFSFSVGTTLNNSDGNGELESVIQYYNKSGNLAKTDSINQHSDFEAEVRGYNTRAVYTEPLFKRSLLEFSASKNESRSTSDKITYDYDPNSGKYDIVNQLLTNNYENIYGTTTAGIRIRTQKKKYNYSFGLTWQNADLKGTITSGIKDSVITKSFYNILPNARFQYNFTRFKNLQLDYRASTNQPSVTQLQPIPDISNQINIKIGNPNLKQEFTHRVNVNYTGMNPFRNKSFFWFSSYSFTNNKIVNYDVIIDSFGTKLTTPVNVDGVYNLSNDISIGWPLRFIKATLNFNTGLGYSKTIQFIETIRNNIYNTNISPRVEISKSFKDKFDLTLNGGFTYNKAKYSLASSLNNNYLTQDYGIDAGWQLPKNFYLSTDFTYTISSQRSEGFNAKVPLWNASFSKLFLKYNRGEMKISVHDLLNENEAIVRYTNSNYIEDQSNCVLKRFYLLSFTYSLNKMSANAGGPGGKGNIIIRR